MLCSRPWYSRSDSDSISDIVVVWNTSADPPTTASTASASEERAAPARARRPSTPNAMPDSAITGHGRRAIHRDRGASTRRRPHRDRRRRHHPVAAGADVEASSAIAGRNVM